MRIAIVTHATRGSRTGNRVTAERWARALRSLGHRTRVTGPARDPACDVLIVLNAAQCAATVLRSQRTHPMRPAIVALTGTDLDRRVRQAVRPVLALADRLVVLQRNALDALPPSIRAKTRLIEQAVELPRSVRRTRAARREARTIRVVALSHLRAVKHPMLLPAALDLLPPDTRMRAVHVGGALDPALARNAARRSSAGGRWRWIGERPRARALAHLARSDLLVLTSRAEGGPGVLGEAAALGVPVLASRVPGVVGVLGARHPGLFRSGDAAALARALRRFERDAAFRTRLRAESARLAHRLRPVTERAAWRRLLHEVTGTSDRARRGQEARVGSIQR